MMNKIKPLALVFLFSLHSIAQDHSAFLSKKDMYADFDSLINYMEKHNPHLPIYKKLMGLDIISELKINKKAIDTIQNYSDFYFLIYSSLTKFPEIHTRLVKKRELTFPIFDSITFANYDQIYNDSKKTGLINKVKKITDRYKIPVTYINGSYYVVDDFIINNRGDSTKIQKGFELTRINNLKVNSFVNKYKKHYTYSLYPLQWDVINNVLYSKEVLLNDKLLKNQYNFIEFINPKNNNIVEIHYDSNTVLINPYESTRYFSKNKILYFDNILFLKIANMSDDNNYFETELQKYKNSKIQKLIIDVRDNPGGSDYVWENILSSIIDTTLVRKEILAIKQHNNVDNSFYDSALGDYYKIIVDSDYIHEIKPNSNSINYKGKIYLIHNRNSFSSANAFVTFALSNEKIIAVGERTGYIEGYGLSPTRYQLPNSKLVFQMISTIHMPEHSDDLRDYFGNKTEIEIITTPLFESILYENRYRDIYTEEFLKNDDIFVKKILENN